MDKREEDIQTLCRAVIENYEEYNLNGPDYCKFCGSSRDDGSGGYLHKISCAVLIAKDLSTNGGARQASSTQEDAETVRDIILAGRYRIADSEDTSKALTAFDRLIHG